MMELQEFKHGDFGTVHVVEIDGEPWFMGKDVAEILGYANTSKAISDHVDAEDKKFPYFHTSQNVRNESKDKWMVFINESGLYSLILSSKKPEAKKFKRWVTSELLPSIRKTGKYISDNVSKTVTPEWYCDRKNVKALLLALDNTQEENEILKIENAEQCKQISEMKPKVEYYDTVLESKELLTVTQIAADYGRSAKWLNKILEEKKIQYKQNGQWILYQFYKERGYAQSVTIPNPHGGCYPPKTRWTQKGRAFIYQLLASMGIFPIVKQDEQQFLKIV